MAGKNVKFNKTMKYPILEKPVVSSASLHPVLNRRWSPRAFSSEIIPDKLIRNLFEAARWSPSASNEQPWSFILGFKGDQTYESIFNTLVEFNQLWAVKAPVLVLACGRTLSLKNPGKQNAHWQYDVGQAVAHLSFQAMSDGLFVHQMSGFDAKLAENAFQLPADIKAVTVIAIGYYGDASLLHPNLQKLEQNPRDRRPLSETVFAETLGNTAAIALDPC